MHCGFDHLHGAWACSAGALAEYFVRCLHVQHCSLRVVSRVEHRHALVDGLLDDVVRIARQFLGLWNQDRIDDVNDAIGGFNVCLYHLRIVDG